MSYKKVVKIVLLLFMVVVCQNVLAQNSYIDTKVDDMTDAQVRQLMQRGAAIGYNDTQLEQMAASMGMAAPEVEKLKTRIAQIRKQDNQAQVSPRNAARTFDPAVEDTGAITKTTEARDASGRLMPRIFGEELFKNSKITFTPNLRIATPRSYVIGPDDELLIDLSGDNEANYNLKVSTEGTIRMQYVGIISVGGLTIEQATSKIRRSMASAYPRLNSGRTSLAVNLGNIKSIKVTIVGEVVKPGSYTLSSLSSVFNALYASGGPNQNGSFRRIQLIRGNKVVSRLDVYDFLLKGIQNDIKLQDQDVINIPVYKTRVQISGEVKRPALFEVTGDETLADVISFAGGFSSQAYTASVKVSQNTSKERRVMDVDANNFKTYKPLNGDQYVVETILDRFENRVEIGGAVFRPGKFQLEQGMTLKQLIQKADGLREDAFLNSGYIMRLKKDNSLSLLSFHVDKIMNGSEPDIPLFREDKVVINSIFDLRDEYKIEVQGEVRKPGVFTFAENTNLETAIQMAGGFKEGATPNRVEIARRVKNSDATATNAVTAQIFSVNIDKNLRVEGSPFILQPFDIVSVHSSEGYEVQRSVSIEGEVLYPGRYVIQRKDERLSDLIKRAGGLTVMAFPEGASLRRPGPTAQTQANNAAAGKENSTVDKTDIEKERLISLQRLQKQQADAVDTASLKQDPSIVRSDLVGINLKKILAKPTGREDLLLEDGDILKVPKVLQTVRVSGEVLKPTNIIYEPGKSLSDYVRESGGYTNDAKKRGSYVQYANGSINSTKKVLFFRSYPTVKPGAEIFVPKRQPKSPLGTQAFIGIASALASLAVVVVALFR